MLPAHTVAIAMHLTTVYPTSSPGGWNILGTALQALYDPHRPEPFLLKAGDRVRLVRSDGVTRSAISPVELPPPAPRLPSLRVDEPGLLDIVVDAGRFGEAHDGMAESGPADRGAALLANALVGNAAGTPVVEMTMNGPQLTALRPLVVACAGLGGALEIDGEIAGWQTERVAAGARLRVRGTARGARSYLAVAGGFEVRRVLGSASTDSRGLIGRALIAGDVLGAKADTLPAARLTARPPDPGPGRPIRLLPGPQFDAAALAALCAGSFTVGVGDRIGVRLDGPPVPGGEILSESPPLGALQVTPAGVPTSCSPTACERPATPSRRSCTPATSAASRSCAPRSGLVRRPARAGGQLVPRPHVAADTRAARIPATTAAHSHSAALVRHHAHQALTTKASSTVR